MAAAGSSGQQLWFRRGGSRGFPGDRRDRRVLDLKHPARAALPEREVSSQAFGALIGDLVDELPREASMKGLSFIERQN